MNCRVNGKGEEVLGEHILLTYATRRPYNTIPALPDGIKYDAVSGYWTKDGTPLVVGGEFEKASKKCDQETGEDQKGE